MALAVNSRLYPNMVVPGETACCARCGGELWRGAQGSVQCCTCVWWGWLRDEQMNPLPSQADHLTKALRDAEHEERMANWKRGYDAGVIAGRREVQEAIRQALGLDDRYEMMTQPETL